MSSTHDSGGEVERSSPTFVASDTLPVGPLDPATQSSAELEAPRMLGHYELRGELGRGGMGVVYGAWDTRLDRRVAIKMLGASDDGQRKARLLREAKAMAKLTHPNVVTVHEIGEQAGGLYIVMEHVAGQTLRALLDGPRPPALAERVRVLCEAGRGLAAIHEAGLVHRDVKPDNIMIRASGQVLVMDLGIAAGELERAEQGPIDTDELLAPGKLTRTGVMMGSPGYMPPEQFKQREITPLSDQFSFCVTLYEAAYGARPFHGETLRELARAVNHSKPRPPAGVASPAWLQAALERGLAVEPHARYGSMLELVEALEQGLGGARPRRWPWLLAAGLASLVGVGLWLRSPEPEPRAAEPAAAASASGPAATSDVDELVALAQVVGALRYFHPSDAAAAADWHALTREAVLAVTAGEDAEALREALAAVIAPVAPLAQIYFEDDPPPPPELQGSGPPVVWQHDGVAVGADRYRGYRSTRTNRANAYDRYAIRYEAVLPPGAGQTLRARVRARVERADASGSATMWLSQIVPGEDTVFEPSNTVSIELGTEGSLWQDYELVHPLARGAYTLDVGVQVSGQASVWIDDLQLELEGPDGVPITLTPPEADFEDPAIPKLKSSDLPGWEHKVVFEFGPRGRNGTLRIAHRPGWQPGQAFLQLPPLGETRELSLGHGLSLRVPICLPDSLARVPAPPAGVPEAPAALPDDPASRRAALLLAWSVLDQFWPYFDVVEVDWDEALRSALLELERVDDRAGLRAVLERMIAKLDDGFASIHAAEAGAREGVVPVRFAEVEGKVLVTHALPDAGPLPGDELLSLDEVELETLLERFDARTSGSPQWKRSLALGRGRISAGPLDEKVELELRRGAQLVEVSMSRVEFMPSFAQHAAIEFMDDGVAYVDLRRVTWAEFEAQLGAIASAPGVVFDLRGRPEHPVQGILQHLLAERGDDEWMFIPEELYPDAEPVGQKAIGWHLPPAAEPFITGRVAFISDGSNIGFGESLLGLVEGYGVGAIVGTPSAGTNGNRNLIELPLDLQLSFTGMVVTRIDGRQHHRLGIAPTLPVEPSAAGIEAGRDEQLDAALDYVRGPQPSG